MSITDGQELSRRQVDCCVHRRSGIRLAYFGGADDGRGKIDGRPWSGQWPREVRRAAGGPTTAAGGSLGFGGADDGRRRFGGAVDGIAQAEVRCGRWPGGI